MRSRSGVCMLLLLALAIAVQSSAAQDAPQEGEQQFGELGECRLESGERILDCRVGYRTYGRMNADQSNILVFLTWFDGTSEHLRYRWRPGAAEDPERYYIIVIDALANGVSSSPSNSPRQPRMQFPRLTIRDMVASQHRLLTEVLGLRRVRAVMGSSMGGTQAFEWAVAYPHFMEKVVTIVGTPQQTSYDLLLWHAMIEAIRSAPEWNGGDYARSPKVPMVGYLYALTETRPARFIALHPVEQFPEVAARLAQRSPVGDANDFIRGAQAMMAHDITRRFGGSWEKTAAAVKAKMLIITGRHDHIVNPSTAYTFARAAGAELLDLENDCGHGAEGCEHERVSRAIAQFLAR